MTPETAGEVSEGGRNFLEQVVFLCGWGQEGFGASNVCVCVCVWPSIIIITHGEQMLQAVYNHEIQALNDTLWVCELAQKAQYIA